MEWACVLCGRYIQNDWASRAMNPHNICSKLEHSPIETIGIIQKTAAMGNWWLAASSRQCTCSCIMSHAELFGETSNYPSDSVSLQPKFGTLWLRDFPKTKITLKGKRFQTIDKLQENTTGQLMTIWRTVWGPKVPTLKGTEVSLPYVQCFLYFVSSSINVSIFHSTWLNIFCTDLIYTYISENSLSNKLHLHEY